MGIDIIPLTPALATTHAQTIVHLLDHIPLVEKHTEADLLANKKEGRTYHAKWHHSYLALWADEPVGVLIGYEREKEQSGLYAYPTIYISSLAVDAAHWGQGFAKQLIRRFIMDGQESGLSSLTGEFVFAVQTNSAAWNKPVQALYEQYLKRWERPS